MLQPYQSYRGDTERGSGRIIVLNCESIPHAFALSETLTWTPTATPKERWQRSLVREESAEESVR